MRRHEVGKAPRGQKRNLRPLPEVPEVVEAKPAKAPDVTPPSAAPETEQRIGTAMTEAELLELVNGSYS